MLLWPDGDTRVTVDTRGIEHVRKGLACFGWQLDQARVKGVRLTRGWMRIWAWSRKNEPKSIEERVGSTDTAQGSLCVYMR